MLIDHVPLLNSLLLGLAASCIALPLGIMAANVIRRRGLIGKIVAFAMIVMLMFPLFLHVSLWDAAFGKLGWLTSTRGQVLTPIVSGWTAAAWIHGIAATPQVAIIFLLGLSTGWHVHEEQASLDASSWQILVHIKLRRLLPLGAIAILWVIVACSREIAVTDIYRIETLAEQIYLGYSLGALGSVAGNWSAEQMAAASEFQLGWSLLPFLGVALAFAWGLTRIAAPSRALDEWSPARYQKPTVGWSLGGIMLLILLVVVPFSNVLYRCGFGVKPVEGTAIAGFSWTQFGDVLGRVATQYGQEFSWSTTISAVSATLILATAIPICWFAVRNFVCRFVFIFLVALCLTVPGPLIGTVIAETFASATASWIVWLYDRTIFAPTIATIFFFWPLAAILVWYLFSRINQDSIAHARLDGAGAMSILWHFGIRANAFSLLGCWLVTFALCFGELSASQLVLPPGMDTLPRLMLGLLHAGVDEITAGITILIAGTILVVSVVAYLLMAGRLTNTAKS